MTQEELNTVLYERISAEQEEYRAWLLTQPPEEILNHAYEYTIRADIAIEFESLELTSGQAKALLASPTPLADLYADFQKVETNHMDYIRESIENRADYLLEAQQEISIYPHSASYASEHGELEQYQISFKANLACKEAIEEAIAEHYHDNRLDAAEAAAQVVGQFGYDRTFYVLAATVSAKEHDGRISRESVAWAKTIPVVEDVDSFGHNNNVWLIVDQVHPGLLDIFVRQIRQECSQTQDRHEDERHSQPLNQTKPSIRKQLQDHTAAPKPPTEKRTKGQER